MTSPNTWRVWLVAVAAVVLTGLQARAHPAVDAAVAEYDKGHLDVALIRLQEAEKKLGLTEADLVTIQWYRAACLLGSGKRAAALAALDRVVELQPLFDPGVLDASPVMRDALEERRTLWVSQHGVVLARPTLLQDGTLQVSMERNPAGVATLLVFARAPGEPVFSQFVLPVVDGVARGPLPDEVLWRAARRAGRLELALEARGPRNTPLARLGSPAAPLGLEVPAQSDPLPAVVAQPPPERQPPVTPPGLTAGQSPGAEAPVAAPPADPPAPRAPAPVAAAAPVAPPSWPRWLWVAGSVGLVLGGAAAVLGLAGLASGGLLKAAINLVRVPWAGTIIVPLQVTYITLGALGGVALLGALLLAVAGGLAVAAGVLG